MYDDDKDYSEEAIRILKIIDREQLEGKEIAFIVSIDRRLHFKQKITFKQITWMRDIKDKQ